MSKSIRLNIRPRRLRKSSSLRNLVRETTLSASDFVLPLFVTEGTNKREPIASMPGQYRLSVDELLRQAERASRAGLSALALFPVIESAKKDQRATESANPNGLIPRCLKHLKKEFPDFVVITDVAMDPYSSDGHDGLLSPEGDILNDETLEILAEQAVTQARAGADFVAPSDMMDGRVGYIRTHLDQAGFEAVGIISYAAKYASAYYGPFRDALDSAPKTGDKKTYQMDPGNRREALKEVALDLREGADMVMVKPALNYLDIIFQVKQKFNAPVAAYHVSGEYSMVLTAAEKGYLDASACLTESLTCIKRAGADLIFTYAAIEAAEWLKRD